jgi:acyl-CoA dehydrogenase
MESHDTLALEMAGRLLRDRCDDAVLAAADGGAWQGPLWTALSEFGLPLALVDEARGGLGMDPAAALAIVRLAGRHALPLPMPETMVANWLLDRAGLPVVAEGPATVAAEGLMLAPEAGGWRLTGTAAAVPWARSATIVGLAAAGGTTCLVLAGTTPDTLVRGANIAHEPRDAAGFDRLLPASAVAPAPQGLDPLAILAALRCAQMAGAIEATAGLAIAHVTTREQFGRPLARNQAIQQALAVLAENAAAASAAADLATAAAASAPTAVPAIAAAKIRIGEAAGTVAAIAHQVHGAIGVAQEYRLHHLTRRLWSWREEFGNETRWSRWLGHRMAGAGAAGLWAAIAAI